MSATGPYWISDDDDEQRDSQSDYDLIGYSKLTFPVHSGLLH